VHDGVAVIRLDRPPANAIDRQLGEELIEAIRDAEADPAAGAIVVWGGPKIFAAGADVRAMATWGPEEVRPSVDALGGACDLLEAIGTVSIAAVNGYALGGGLELALACDLRYLATDANVGQPEIKLGVIPGAGGTQRLVRAIGPGRARDLVYTGRTLSAEEAERLGSPSGSSSPTMSCRPRRGRSRVRSGTTPGARGGQGGDRGRHRNARCGWDPGRASGVPRAVRDARSARGDGGVP
jgi:enoyl-CoA hydratase/carnithine racemase